jgi:transposase
LRELGWKQKDIAQAFGVSEGAVSHWFKKAGVQALRHQPPPGVQAKLTKQQMAQIPEELAKGAEAFGFCGDVWTTARVAFMIKQVFGVSYHPAHCSLLLRQICQSQQKPIQRASQRDEDAMRTWKQEQWPALKKTTSAIFPC